MRRFEDLSDADKEELGTMRKDWAEAWFGVTPEKARQPSSFSRGEGGSSMSTGTAPSTSNGHEGPASVASKWTLADQAKLDSVLPEIGSRPSSVAYVVERKDSATFESPTNNRGMQDGLHTNGETFRTETDAGPKPSLGRVSISEASESPFDYRSPSWIDDFFNNRSRRGSVGTAITVLGPENATDDIDSFAPSFPVGGNEAGGQNPFSKTPDAPLSSPIWVPVRDRSEGRQVAFSPSRNDGNAESCCPLDSIASSSHARYDPVPIPPAYQNPNYYDGNPESASAHSASLGSSTSDYDTVPIPQPYLDVNAYGEPVAPARPKSRGIFGGLRSARRHLPKLKQWKPSSSLRPRNLAFWGAKRNAALKAAVDNGYIV